MDWCVIQVHRLNVFRPSFAIQGCSTLVRKSETKVSIESMCSTLSDTKHVWTLMS